MFLITGAGRSGSTYMTKVLQKCGLDVGHHKMGKDGIVCGFYCMDAKKYPTGMPSPCPKFDVILHQVREPLKSIASLQTGRSWKWTSQFLPIPKDAPILVKACYNWLIFNEHAEKQALWTYRIENLENVWMDLQRVLVFDTPYDKVANISKKTNTRKHNSVTWEDVKKAVPEIYEKIKNAAERYGYVYQTKTR